MRRGISLIEILAAIPILMAVMLVFSGLLYASLRDVPKLQQVANTNGVLSHMIQRLQQDVDVAESLPKSAFGTNADETLLLLRMSDSTVSYKIQNGEIIREKLASGRGGQEKKSYRWPAPGAKVSFHRWQNSGGAYAVEVRRAVEYTKQGHSEEKLVNSHVLYLDNMPGYREKQ